MAVFKNIILLALTALMIVGCLDNTENQDGTFSVSVLPRTYILDSCE